MLVIHIISRDDTRDFDVLYRHLDVRVMINPSRGEARRAIMDESDTVMLIGHGTEHGLLNDRLNGYIIDSSMVQLLRERTVIGIWCYAGNFADRYGLRGFFTSNFISNVDELLDCGFEMFDDADDVIRSENVRFAENVNVMLRDRTPLSEWVDLLRGSIENNDRQFVLYNYEALYYN